MTLRHPSRKRLERWFEGADSEAGLDDHLDTCERCAAVIEELADGHDPVNAALEFVLAPPDDLRTRIEQGINTRLQNRQDLSVIADLMGIGIHTARLLIGDARPDGEAGPNGTTEEKDS